MPATSHAKARVAEILEREERAEPPSANAAPVKGGVSRNGDTVKSILGNLSLAVNGASESFPLPRLLATHRACMRVAALRCESLTANLAPMQPQELYAGEYRTVERFRELTHSPRSIACPPEIATAGGLFGRAP